MLENYPGTRQNIRKATLENKQNPEKYRLTVSFDFVFGKDENGKKKVFCIELNGHNSGIYGINSIESGDLDKTKKLISLNRMTVNSELEKVRSKIDLLNTMIRDRIEETIALINEIENEELRLEMLSIFDGNKIHFLYSDLQRMLKGLSSENQELSEIIGQNIKYILNMRTTTNRLSVGTPLFENANINKNYVEEILEDKVRQQGLIPEKYRPEKFDVRKRGEYKPEDLWIVKPIYGVRGKDINILKTSELEYALEKSNALDSYENGFLIQKFIPSTGAELAPRKLKKNPQSMRLLWDVTVRKDGKVHIDYEAGYQRVSKEKYKDRNRDNAVVNLATGALAYPASKKEVDMAKEAASDILTNLIKYIELEDDLGLA